MVHKKKSCTKQQQNKTIASPWALKRGQILTCDLRHENSDFNLKNVEIPRPDKGI